MFKKAIAKRKLAKAESKKAKVVSGKAKVVSFSKASLLKDIKREARTIGISDGAAEKFAVKVGDAVEKWTSVRGGVTESDINRQVAKEIAKYSKDLSFIYKNRGKII